MSNLYERIRRNLIKPTVCIGLLALTSGCGSKAEEKPSLPTERPNSSVVKEKQVEKTYFDNWGFINELKLSVLDGGFGNRDHKLGDDLEITLGDLDNDGDLDIVVGSKATGLRTYENRIPQKK